MDDTPRRDAGFDVSRVLVWAVVAAVVATAIGAAFVLPRRSGDSGTEPPAAPPSDMPGAVPGDWSDEPGAAPDPDTGLFPRAVGTWLDVPAVERSGLELRTGELRGRFLVVDFVFTSCRGTCPPLQAAMQEFQAATAGATDVRSVSISVDPANDTVDALSEWADALHADRARWHFLRIAEPEVRRLMRDGLKVPTADELIAHSGLFLLVDPDGAVRGRYSPLVHANWLPVLLADLAKLRAERGGR